MTALGSKQSHRTFPYPIVRPVRRADAPRPTADKGVAGGTLPQDLISRIGFVQDGRFFVWSCHFFAASFVASRKAGNRWFCAFGEMEKAVANGARRR